MTENREVAIQITNLKKRYRLGVIGGGTLQGDIQSWWARIRGKEDPNLKIGQTVGSKNETFMALDGIDLTVYKGERLGIIGHNGAGKSTMLKLLSRVTAPTEGKISINGRISSMLEVGTGFNPELTGRENVYLNGAILGMTKAEVDKKIDQIIEFSECGQFIDTPVKRYSSGMYVKLAFSVAAHLDSEILIMDEVLAVGDLAFQQKCLNKMSEVSRNEGRTVLYVSHNMNTIQKLCNRCIVLDHGRVKYAGDVQTAIEIYSNMANYTELYKDYSTYKRKYKMYADDIRILSARFLNKSVAAFERKEKMCIQIKWVNENDVKPIGLRFEVNTALGEPLCTYLMENLYTGRKDKEVTANIEVDISNLVPGKYLGFYTFFYKNQYGYAADVDNVPAIGFEVLGTEDEDKYIKWNTNYWGSIQMPCPTIQAIEEK